MNVPIKFVVYPREFYSNKFPATQTTLYNFFDDELFLKNYYHLRTCSTPPQAVPDPAPAAGYTCFITDVS